MEVDGAAMAEKLLYPPPLLSHEEVANDRAAFMDTLRRFHSLMGTKFMIPVIGGKEMDLHALYVEVTSRGGLAKVMEERKWREVMARFSFPATTTSASYVLRRYYLSLLHHYEQVYFFRAHGALLRPAASALTKTPRRKMRGTSDQSPAAAEAGKRMALPERLGGGRRPPAKDAMDSVACLLLHSDDDVVVAACRALQLQRDRLHRRQVRARLPRHRQDRRRDAERRALPRRTTTTSSSTTTTTATAGEGPAAARPGAAEAEQERLQLLLQGEAPGAEGDPPAQGEGVQQDDRRRLEPPRRRRQDGLLQAQCRGQGEVQEGDAGVQREAQACAVNNGWMIS
ncbi:uncharacterized protein LOC127784376 isoform X1 [Oryza glaberrima]|uniref:uncharacterized protein LOC127784376 isoform X1 n=1 Tax=Oryza glaberrima TaxID=4538 RepID=UPI00224C5795|nr:uncharacterized protein LOC127784376 isoform X1 [Oryza glaberrima]